MKNKRRISIINVVLIILLVLCFLMGVLLILLSKSKVDMIGKIGEPIKNSYTTTEETTITNTWDISVNGDGSVNATLSEDGTLTISGTGDMKDWSGSENASWYNDKDRIKLVIIDSGITNIGNYAFNSCTILENIQISESVVNIGKNSFRWCNKLTNIEVAENNINYTDVNGVLYSKDKTKLIRYPEGKVEKEYTVLDNTTSIESNAFYFCSQLTSIELPQNLTSIGDHAFYFCGGLTTIEIPEGVTEIGADIVRYCSNLTNIEVAENNINYTDVNGVLYSKDKRKLIRYPEGKNEVDYAVLNGVTTIENDAFAFAINLTSIKVPNSMISIGVDTFFGCAEQLTIVCKSGSWMESVAKEWNMNYQIDDTPPVIDVVGNFSTEAVRKVELTVNVTDEIAGTDEQNLKYLFSMENENITKEQIINTFINGETLELKDVTGTYYLWIYAVDKVGNETLIRTDEIYLDNIKLTAEVIYSTQNPTNENVTVTIKTNTNIEQVEGWTLSTNGQELSKEYADNTVEAGENITIKDLEGNETIVNVKIINIDKIFPQLTLKSQIISSSIKVEATASDQESGIDENTYKYYIKEENGEYGTAVGSGNSHTFINLSKGVKYQIKVDVSDNAGNVTAKEIEVTILNEDKIESTCWTIDEENQIIKGINPKVTVELITQNLKTESRYEINDSNGDIVSNNVQIATGFKIKLESGKTYTIIVKGDTNGDGEADIKDILAINKHRLKKATLTGIYVQAADVNEDNVADIKDILQINKFRLGKITEL